MEFCLFTSLGCNKKQNTPATGAGWKASYLIGLFDNLMEGGEDAESTGDGGEVVGGEWDRRGQDGRRTDRQKDRQGVSAGTGIWGSDTHTEAVLSG